jgi:putative SOS response-associated peptidase YedK
MCGRYELHTHPAAIALAFGLPHPPAIGPRYNIAPMQDVPVVRVNRAGERELAQVRWGLVPRWAKDPSIGARMINARAETVADKPAFRMALRWHRCLIPSDGFYEWKAVPGAGKQPMHIGMKSGEPFALAGLTERWLSPEGEVLDTCAIVTTEANSLLAPLHDRMPLIIAPQDYARWLDKAEDDVTDLFRPFPSEAMQFWPVSTRVNAVRNDDAALIERVEETQPTESDVAEEHVPEQAKLF